LWKNCWRGDEQQTQREGKQSASHITSFPVS
jgi:hypothetical protein